MTTNLSLTIAQELKIPTTKVSATIKLLDEGNTIPFVARYRKEVTGSLDEEQIRTIEQRMTYLRNLSNRKEEILTAIENQGKLTEELALAIKNAKKLLEVEDLYLPYKQKKRTRALIASERGLLPLAEKILAQKTPNVSLDSLASSYLDEEKGVSTIEEAWAGACDIVAQIISERADIRQLVRLFFKQNALISSELIVDETAGQPYLMYKDYTEPIKQLPPHRILALNRGEKTKCLKLKLEYPLDLLLSKILKKLEYDETSAFAPLFLAATTDSFKRLIEPAIEREIRNELTEKAETQAISVFSTNLRQLLLQQPLGGHTILGLDPGYRTGCKAAVVNPLGDVLDFKTLYLTASDRQLAQAEIDFLQLVKKHKVTLVSIGNGTASYETEEFTAKMIEKHNLDLSYVITSEAGASVYSASKLAREELPELDVTIRGAVSIARRIQDPLAELVKIDPQAIGVGQYQHDVNQKELSTTLDSVVESCVNHVGIDLNTASPALLTHIAGISSSVANNIVAWRTENGRFTMRKELLKVKRLGPSAFTQCAGFLKIQNGKNPLDNTSVHPESYALAEKILLELGFKLTDFTTNTAKIQKALTSISKEDLAHKLSAGLPTVTDILEALSKPGRDPREDAPAPMTRKNIKKLSDLQVGSIVKGRVQNVIDFGAFVDIGIKVSGLIHKSQLSTKYFKHPLDVVSVGDIVEAVIISIDEKRNRIGLSLKQVPKEKS